MNLSDHSIKYPIQFLGKIKKIQINDELMISFDDAVLFTSLGPHSEKETLFLLLTNDTNLAKYTKLQSQSFIGLIDLRLTYFLFHNEIYKQTKRITNIRTYCISSDAETGSLDLTSDQAKKLDSLCGQHIRHCRKGRVGKRLQSDLQRLRWHKVHNRTIVKQWFLDASTTVTDTGKLETQVYWKPDCKDQILNTGATTARTHNTNCVQTLLNKATTHCNTFAARKNEGKYVIAILRKNGYPINFIKKWQPNASAET